MQRLRSLDTENRVTALMRAAVFEAIWHLHRRRRGSCCRDAVPLRDDVQQQRHLSTAVWRKGVKSKLDSLAGS